MKRRGWIFTQEGTIWANGHWQSTGSGERTWDGEGILRPVDCILAPYYGVFTNGAFLGRTDVRNLSWTMSADANIDFAKIPVEVKPYIPRTTDGYYDWSSSQGQQQPLKWITGENGCAIRFWDADGQNYTDTMTIPANTDLSTEQFDLIQPEYDYYIFRGLFSTLGYSYNAKTAYDALTGSNITYDFQATKHTGQSPRNFLGLYGSFGNENDHYYNNTTTLMEKLYIDYDKGFGAQYYGTEAKVVTGGTPPLSPFTQTSWSGKQYPSIWHTGSINSQFIPYNGHNLPGFIYPSNFNLPFYRTNDPEDVYTYAQVFILKGLKKIRGTITG